MSRSRERLTQILGSLASGVDEITREYASGKLDTRQVVESVLSLENIFLYRVWRMENEERRKNDNSQDI